MWATRKNEDRYALNSPSLHPARVLAFRARLPPARCVTRAASRAETLVKYDAFAPRRFENHITFKLADCSLAGFRGLAPCWIRPASFKYACIRSAASLPLA